PHCSRTSRDGHCGPRIGRETRGSALYRGRTRDRSIDQELGSMKQDSSVQEQDPWQVLLQGASANIGLPSDRSRGAGTAGGDAVVAVDCDIPPERFEAISGLARTLGTDVRGALLAAWIAWLWRMSGQQGVLLGVGDGVDGMLALDVAPEAGWTLQALLAHITGRAADGSARGVLDAPARDRLERALRGD